VLRRLSGSPNRPESSPLTPRETEILKLIAEGIGNAEIGERLHIGLGTVKGHVADILDKLSASDRAQAAVTAYRRGLIP
jgi:DNA-binding NarL/FixJ family response regulator